MREKAGKIFRFDFFPELRHGQCRQIMTREEMRFLHDGKAHIGVSLEKIRKGRRPAARRSYDERESLDVVYARHHAGTPSRRVWLRHNWNQATLRQAAETLSAVE